MRVIPALGTALRLPAAALWAAIVVGRWLETQFAHPVAEYLLDTVLTNWEEGAKSLLREGFGAATRAANGATAWALSLLVDRRYWASLREGAGSRRAAAWQAYWREGRPSTLNAVVARAHAGVGGGGGTAPASVANGAPPAAPPPAPAATKSQAPPPPQPPLPAPPSRWPPARAAARAAAATAAAAARALAAGRSALAGDAPPRVAAPPLRRSPSDLFERGAWAPPEAAKRRGILEDARLGCEVALAAACDGARRVVRLALFMSPPPDPVDGGAGRAGARRPAGAPAAAAAAARAAAAACSARTPASRASWEDLATRPRAARFRRSSSTTTCELLSDVQTVGDAISAAGYPLEVHTVTTSDGYVLEVARIPRPGARDVALFVHGILDTPLGWVSNGVTGSLAFAAWDGGHDVWLANSRANPPGTHVDPRTHGVDGWRYWKYSVNEMGLEDVAATVDHVHCVKVEELSKKPGRVPSRGVADPSGVGGGGEGGAAARSSAPSVPPGLAPEPLERGFRRHAAAGAALAGRAGRGAASDTEVDAASAAARGARLSGAAAPSGPAGGPAPPNEASIRQAAAGEAASAGPARRIGGLRGALRRTRGASARTSDGGGPALSTPVGRAVKFVSEDGGRAVSAGAGRPAAAGDEDADDAASAPPPAAAAATATPPPSTTPPPLTDAARRAERRVRDAAAASAAAPSYRLRAVGHSLGGAALLTYAVMCRRVGRPHHLDRLVLLTPAGFQDKPPAIAYPFILCVPAAVWLLERLSPLLLHGPGVAGMRFHLPTSPLRYLTFKLTNDLRRLPAVRELVRAFLRALFSGDTSQWDRALQLPHYSAHAMPAISLHTGNHLCQWIRSGKFQLYDYGGPGGAGNLAHYGMRAPPDIAGMYSLLDVPVDIVAGRADGVVAAANCARHYAAMRAAGREVTYREFPDTGHMDFVVAAKDDVRAYVLKLLRARR